MTPVVLVVDDAQDVRRLVRQVLEDDGMQVIEAVGGAAALAALAGGADPSLVFLDVQMPDLDGWDTLAAIRGGVAPETSVVVCSVKSSEEDVRRAWLLGCDGYVMKPFDVDTLVAELRAVLGRSTAARDALRAERLRG